MGWGGVAEVDEGGDDGSARLLKRINRDVE